MGIKRLDIDTSDLVRRYLAGESEKALSVAFKIARTAIRPRLLSAGVKPRGRSDANRLRLQRATKDQRMKWTEAAHSAWRGMKKTPESLEKAAAARQQQGGCGSELERVLLDLLRDRGLDPIPQQAVGPYSCDLGAYPVAVEVLGGNWHSTGRRHERIRRRTRYLMDRGWSVLMICVDNRRGMPISGQTADYVISYLETVRRNPTHRPEYRVVRSTGKTVSCGSVDDEKISLESPLSLGRNSANGRHERVPRNA